MSCAPASGHAGTSFRNRAPACRPRTLVVVGNRAQRAQQISNLATGSADVTKAKKNMENRTNGTRVECYGNLIYFSVVFRRPFGGIKKFHIKLEFFGFLFLEFHTKIHENT